MSENPKILFLYSELAGYSIACLNALVSAGAEVHVVRKPVNNEAPFVFENETSVRYYERGKFNRQLLMELVLKIKPALIVVSGWVDKDYLAVSRNYRKQATQVLVFDNQWTGSIRQRMACLVAKYAIIGHFDAVWVPGERQIEFAERLGFKDGEIYPGFYSCDSKLYSSFYDQSRHLKEKHFPRRFVFVGRYYEFKGILDLWKAFTELYLQGECKWELWCLGTGDLVPVEYPGIRHFGFVQPDQMEDIIQQTGVFILPSHFEPWGVAVQEFATAGFPLICSDEVGAADAFLKEESNGYGFKSGNVQDLKRSMKRIMGLSDEKLIEMARQSHLLGTRINPESWALTALSMAGLKRQ